MIPKCDLHTHTRYCDGKHTAEEMTLGAIALGCEALGLSGHSPLHIENDWCMTPENINSYIVDIRALQENYRDRIELYLGIECDIMSDINRPDFDYVIGSVHHVTKCGEIFPIDLAVADLKAEIDKLYGGDVYAFARDYYENMYTLCECTECDIIGHVDLLTKFNEHGELFDSADKRYRSVALEAVDYLLSKDKIFEINTGAISRGYRSKPYPEDFLLRYIVERGGRVMINSDSHSAENIMFYFPEATEYARSCGVRELTVMKNKKFEQIRI